MLRLSPLLLLLGVNAFAQADPKQLADDWDAVTVAPMKTSIYIGSVSLIVAEFRREGDKFATTYEAKVRPWFFWSETGRVTITLPQPELARLAIGERVEFTGEGTNHKNKPRQITGYAERVAGASGKIKVRLSADGYELIFNGTYRFNNAVK
jgi:hypothetical protein